jgi:protein-S-isoprenylcysteine O-methyltransferase Ste14
LDSRPLGVLKKAALIGDYFKIRYPLYLAILSGFILVPAIITSWSALLIVLCSYFLLISGIKNKEEFSIQPYKNWFKDILNGAKRLVPGIW